MGDGMDQGTARRRAKELGGIATTARRMPGGHWRTCGWTHADDVWIVVSIGHPVVLDDGDGLKPGAERYTGEESE